MQKTIHPLLAGREQALICRKLQRAMREKQLDALVLMKAENVFYATGFRSNFAYTFGAAPGGSLALVPASGPVTLIVSDLEAENAMAQTKDVRVEVYQTPAFIDDGSEASRMDKTPPALAGVRLALHLLGACAGKRIATEQEILTVTADALFREAGIFCIDAVPAVMQARKTKTPWEIETLRSAVQLTERVWNRMAPLAKPGLKAYEFELAFRRFTLEEDPMNATFGNHFIPAYGPHIGLGTTPRDYTMRDGDLIKFDAGYRYLGYTSDIARTLAVGTPGEMAVELYDVLYRANRKGAGMLRAGVRFSDVYWTVRREVEASGLLTHYPRGNVGHSIGVGCAVSEAPFFTKDNDTVLEENMVVTLETPYSGTGDALVCGGYNIEDCYLIQKDGAVQFTFAPDCLKW